MTATEPRLEPQASGEPLDRRAIVTAATLVLGGLLVVLDTTVMNVAIGPLSQSMDTSLPTIQWIITGYTLAMATVMPVIAWAIGRLGGRRVYLVALLVFVAGSALAGLAWNVESLIAFRVVQGLGGGLVMPTVMTIALRAVPPAQRGRMMAILGVPVLIGPVLGPVLGGWLLDSLSWRWIFFVNLPLGLLALVVATRVLPGEAPNPTRRLDIVGLLLLSPGLAALVYGLAAAGETGELLDASVTVPALGGAGLVGGFLVRARRLADPLVDVSLLRVRAMAAGTAVLALFAAAYFGSMFLAPLYYQVVRGESATTSGLLLVPQALATGISMQVAGRLIDRIPAVRVVAAGIALATIGFGTFAIQLAADSSYIGLVLSLSVAGAGVGATLMPTLTTATRDLEHDDVPSGTTLLNITNQVAVSFGVAATSVVLAGRLGDRLPGVADTGVGGLYDLGPDALAAVAPAFAASIQSTFLLPVALTCTALAVAVAFLPGRRRRQARRSLPARTD